MIPRRSKQLKSNFFWPNTAFCWSELALKIILVLASIGAVYQYFDIKQENRVKRTMEQLEKFNNDKLLAARLNLSRVWEPHYKKIRYINKQSVISEEELNQVQINIVIPIVEGNKIQQDIDLLVDFFENLHVCMQNNICDKQTALDFFSGSAKYFFQLHKPWIKTNREIIPTYAYRLEKFINSI